MCYYLNVQFQGQRVNVARKTVTTKRPEMLRSPTSEVVRMWQLLHAALQVVPLLPTFSFSREFVSRQCGSRNYPQDVKSQLPIRVISVTMFFSASTFLSTGFYINKIVRDATVCRCLFTAKLLYMFRVSITPIIRSKSNCNCSFKYSLIYSWWWVR